MNSRNRDGADAGGTGASAGAGAGAGVVAAETGGPRRTRTPALSDSEARARALDSATRLYYGRGIQSVGMDALASDSGIGVKRLYQLFASKESIIEQVLAGLHAQWDADVRGAVDAATTPRDKLLAVYDYLGQWFAQDDFRGCAFINSFGEMGATMPHIAELVREHKRGFQGYITDIAVDAGAPALLGAQLALLAEGAQTTAAIAGDSTVAGTARSAAETLVDAALPH